MRVKLWHAEPNRTTYGDSGGSQEPTGTHPLKKVALEGQEAHDFLLFFDK